MNCSFERGSVWIFRPEEVFVMPMCSWTESPLNFIRLYILNFMLHSLMVFKVGSRPMKMILNVYAKMFCIDTRLDKGKDEKDHR